MQKTCSTSCGFPGNHDCNSAEVAMSMGQTATTGVTGMYRFDGRVVAYPKTCKEETKADDDDDDDESYNQVACS